jgi:hypothetical protein
MTASRVPSVLSRTAGARDISAHGAERDVRASGDGLAAHPLRRHVSGSSRRATASNLLNGPAGRRRRYRVVQGREAEVEDLHATVERNEDVLRLRS